MTERSERVLIVSASIGSGHVAAARALERAFAELGAEVLHVDLLDFTTAPFRRLYRQTYFDLVRSAPDFVDWLGKRLDRVPAPARLKLNRFFADPERRSAMCAAAKRIATPNAAVTVATDLLEDTPAARRAQ